MIDFKHLQGNLIISTTGIGLSFMGKKFFKKEIIPVSSLKQAGMSWVFLMLATIIGKKAMDKMINYNLVKFDTTGKEKHPNEGFIGPLKNETFGPPNWA